MHTYVTEPNLCLLPFCSKASLLTPGRGEESAAFITGHQARRTGSSFPKFLVSLMTFFPPYDF